MYINQHKEDCAPQTHQNAQQGTRAASDRNINTRLNTCVMLSDTRSTRETYKKLKLEVCQPETINRSLKLAVFLNLHSKTQIQKQLVNQAAVHGVNC